MATRGYNLLQKVTRSYKGYMGLQSITGGYKRLQGVTEA